MKNKLIAFLLLLMICLPSNVAEVEAKDYNRVSVVSRDDGTWLFPVDSKYYGSFSDWAGCPGNGTCGFCGKKHSKWGDPYHTFQAPLGHNGIDLNVKLVNVYAAAPGTVVYSGNDESRGKYLIIEHPIEGTKYSYYSYYQHLSKYKVSKGKTVNAGDIIAVSGNTGSGSGYHLHFGIVMAKSGTNIGSRLGAVEKKGWLVEEGYAEKRILNNPSTSAKFPAGAKEVLPPLAAHSGSVTYTFDASKVSIGSEPTFDGIYTLTPKCADGARLDICSAGESDGTNVQIYSANDTDAQKFSFTHLGDGWYTITAEISGKVLDVQSGEATAGSNVQQYTPNGTLAQQWRLESAGDGYYYIISRLDDELCLDVDGEGSEDKTNVQVYTKNDTDAQKWKLELVPPKSTLKIKPTAYPKGTLKKGSYYSLKGKITSNYKITSIKAEIIRSNGKVADTYTQAVNKKSYSLLNSKIDLNMDFNRLSKGTYYLKYTAVDSSGNTVTWSSGTFKVK